MTNEKIEALQNELGEKVTQDGDTFTTESGAEYEVLTDEEANQKAREYILDSLWAFNADFILKHSKNYDSMDAFEYDEAIESLKSAQERGCENLNGLMRCLISDIDEFIQDAIYEDGRGHFISFYDGEELELENGFFAYRVN